MATIRLTPEQSEYMRKWEKLRDGNVKIRESYNKQGEDERESGWKLLGISKPVPDGLIERIKEVEGVDDCRKVNRYGIEIYVAMVFNWKDIVREDVYSTIQNWYREV